MRVPANVVLLSSLAALLLAAAGAVLWSRLRRPKDPEQQRRQHVDSQGRIIEGTITDIRDGHIYYAWTWRGVVYEASQDIRALEHLLPPDVHLLIGPTSIKFLPRNPHNSIVMAENWSGFRIRSTPRTPEPSDTPI